MSTRDDDEMLPRELLDTWNAAEPPPGFAARVVAARTTGTGSGRRTAAVAALSAAAAVLAVVGVQHWPAAASAGRWSGAAGETLRLGKRATVTASAGAVLGWTVEGSGAARVHHESGRAFYRVEHGGEFVVETPAGTVSVLGTCFELDVQGETMRDGSKAGKVAVLGAAGGALVAATVVVSVYEGRVALANSAGETQVAAGATAVARPGSAPRVVDGRGAAMEEQVRRLAAERDHLRTQVAQMEAQVRGMMLAPSQGRDPRDAQLESLQEQLGAVRGALAAERTAQAQRAGEAVPWPADLGEAYKQEGLKRAFLDAIQAAGIQGDVKSIDCSEFPCVVYGEARHEGNKEAAEAEFKRFNEALQRTYPEKGHSTHQSAWSRSTKRADGQPETSTMFAISVYPEDAVDDEALKQVRKRVRHRNQQYIEDSVEE